MASSEGSGTCPVFCRYHCISFFYSPPGNQDVVAVVSIKFAVWLVWNPASTHNFRTLCWILSSQSHRNSPSFAHTSSGAVEENSSQGNWVSLPEKPSQCEDSLNKLGPLLSPKGSSWQDRHHWGNSNFWQAPVPWNSFLGEIKSQCHKGLSSCDSLTKVVWPTELSCLHLWSWPLWNKSRGVFVFSSKVDQGFSTYLYNPVKPFWYFNIRL